MLAKRLTDAIGYQLNDLEVGNEHVRWTLLELLGYITEAIDTVAALRPELLATSVVVPLAVGAVQRVPATIAKLLDVSANVDSGGGFISPITKANYNLTRHFRDERCTVGNGSEASSFRLDPNDPRVFYVQPPAGNFPQQYVRLLGQARTLAVTSVNDDLEFTGGDIATYFSAIKDWALYCAFMKDTESSSSLQRAQIHQKAFYQFMNAKAQMDAFSQGATQRAQKGSPNEDI